MIILLLGSTGQVGWELQRSLQCLGQVIALDRTQADFLNPESLATLVKHYQPQVIVNAAAYTAVDKAQSEINNAFCVNHNAVKILAESAKAIDALLVHYSTDYVFNGTGITPWLETDITAPLNIYGESKLAGEQAIINSGCAHLIFRTSWVYGIRGHNFAKMMLRLAQEKETLNVIDDQMGAPTGADWLADMTAHTIIQTLNHPNKQGLYHAVASGEVSWYGYVQYVLEQAKLYQTQPFKVKTINPVESSAFITAAKRPLNSRLNTLKLQSTFNLPCPDWKLGIARLIQLIKP